MRFSLIYQLASYLMVACAFLPIALSGELAPVVVAATVLAGLASLLVDPARWRLAHTRAWLAAWNLATIIVCAWQVSSWLRGQALLLAGTNFLCFLLINKLWNRRASKDYLQAYVVSFLMLVSATTLNTNLSFALAFFGYVICTTWALILFHLRRELEESYLLKHSDAAPAERVGLERVLQSRRVIGGWFLAATAAVAVGVFISTSLVFLLFPRLELGGLLGPRRSGIAMAGFSDQLEIGGHGLIKDNPQVVMRIEFPTGKPSDPLHFRGIAFDTYLHGHWSHSDGMRRELLRREGFWRLENELLERPTSDAKPKLRQNIYLEPLDVPVLFGATQPETFLLPASRTGWAQRLDRTSTGDVYASTLDAAGRARPIIIGRHYVVFSSQETPPSAELMQLAAPDAKQRWNLRHYLELPADLAPRVFELARTITQGARGPYAQAEAIARYLRSNYRYTLQAAPSSTGEPIEEFLFKRRAGHCEYFATAMAVLLRAAGIPSRSVNGFYGGEWNEFGQYLTVRQGDAHSWVEVYFTGWGWMPFDPTPPVEFGGELGWRGRLRQLADTIELGWFKYVVEYDLTKQLDLALSMRRYIARLSPSKISFPTSAWHWCVQHRKVIFISSLATLLALLLALELRKLRGRQQRPSRKATHAMARALRALERRGLSKRAAETVSELAVRALAQGDSGAVAFTRLVECYYAVRFGGLEIPVQELDSLALQVIRP